ncbi:MAG: ABC-F family ATP-binding cassette domain-containing protein [Bacilli bacterium]|nr:ABC-F family ATP-binding cassette domain-containing protein [Bacilli bacterium]MDD4408122.1 ABC-F family ATP-binding cassette domain-containing protein [Bacilli bacterium]
MIEIGMSNVKKSFGFEKSVLDEFDFEVSTGERIALIGANGSGKTTIFKIITGEESVQAGMVSVRKGATIGLLSQIPPKVTDEVTVRDVLITKVKSIYDLEAKLREYENKMAAISDTDKLNEVIEAYSKLQELFESSGGYEIESKVSKICNGFKISEDKLSRSFNSLSGGEKTIVNLASLMISEPSILLLDEPTNHLDVETLEWFENYLKNYKGTVVISSHDRYFLDQVATKTVLIERGKSEVFHGNYSYFLEENERRIMNEFEDFKNQQKKIDAMKASIKKLQEFGRLAYPGGEPFFKRAASIQKRLDKMELLDRPEVKKDLPLDFQIDGRSGKDVIVVEDLGIILGDKILFDNANFKVQYGEKVCMMGSNGSGKSTFVKAMLGDVPVVEGEIKVGSSVKLGYIPQEIKFEDDKQSVLEYSRDSVGLDETRLRAALAKFGFYGENVFKRVGTLSGGEKVRLKLFELIQMKANLLIMDEPTNHIDIDTKEVLEEALQEYKGTLFFISHDRYFINKLAQKTLNIEDHQVTEYLGNYDYLKEQQTKKFNSPTDTPTGKFRR